MMKSLVRSCGFTLLGVSLLTSCDADHAANGAGPSDGSPSIDLDAMGERVVDTLVGTEAEALCREDARRSDPCLEIAIESTQTPEECNRSVEECHAKSRVEPSASCAGISLGPPGTCSISVDEYFRCVDAWTSTLRCSEAGNAALEPEACRTVVAKCERLAGRFSRNGRLLPCDPDSGTGRPPDTNDDIFGLDVCRQVPARLVILGDSIADCVSSGQICSPKLIAEGLRGSESPGLVFESFAVAGAFLGDTPAQARQVAPGPGHVFVWLFAIGNDILSGLLDRSEDLSLYHTALDEISTYFLDASRFPDGATFLFNTQYGLYDQCDPPGSLVGGSPERGEQLRALNKALFLDRAVARVDTVAVDHYPDWLGHGVNANIRGCPHCGIDNTSWMADPLHPNAFGHGHIAEKWRLAFDQMFASGCAEQLP